MLYDTILLYQGKKKLRKCKIEYAHLDADISQNITQ